MNNLYFLKRHIIIFYNKWHKKEEIPNVAFLKNLVISCMYNANSISFLILYGSYRKIF